VLAVLTLAPGLGRPTSRPGPFPAAFDFERAQTMTLPGSVRSGATGNCLWGLFDILNDPTGKGAIYRYLSSRPPVGCGAGRRPLGP
jgi:hypothetical protein